MVGVLRFGYKDGMTYSKKTSNWLVNKGNGSYEQAIMLIKRVIKIHNFFKAKAVVEVIIWD